MPIKSKTPKKLKRPVKSEAEFSIDEHVQSVEEPETIPEPVIIEEDPNMMKISKFEYKKMTMKIHELETKSKTCEMSLDILNKEKSAFEQSNTDLKLMIENLKQANKELSEGQVLLLFLF